MSTTTRQINNRQIFRMGSIGTLIASILSAARGDGKVAPFDKVNSYARSTVRWRGSKYTPGKCEQTQANARRVRQRESGMLAFHGERV